jgi:hypothetical protein
MTKAPDRFEYRPEMFVGVPTPTLVYVGVANRADFDKIQLPLHDAGENERGHVLVKTLGEFDGTHVTVIFQHWLKSLTTDAFLADAKARRGDAGQPT